MPRSGFGGYFDDLAAELPGNILQLFDRLIEGFTGCIHNFSLIIFFFIFKQQVVVRMNIGYHLHCGFVDFYDPKLIIGIKQMNEDVQGYRKWIHIRVYFIRLQGSPAGTPKSKSIIIKGVILTELVFPQFGRSL